MNNLGKLDVEDWTEEEFEGGYKGLLEKWKEKLKMEGKENKEIVKVEYKRSNRIQSGKWSSNVQL